MNIYTFYEEIEDINKEEQNEMIDIWKESWSKFGWNPIVLSKSDTNISDEQYKLMQRAARDRNDEIKNGWPQGYKENQRSIKKQQRAEKNKSILSS